MGGPRRALSQPSSRALPHSPRAARERPGGGRPGKSSLAAAGSFSAAPGLQPGRWAPGWLGGGLAQVVAALWPGAPRGGSRSGSRAGGRAAEPQRKEGGLA